MYKIKPKLNLCEELVIIWMIHFKQCSLCVLTRTPRRTGKKRGPRGEGPSWPSGSAGRHGNHGSRAWPDEHQTRPQGASGESFGLVPTTASTSVASQNLEVTSYSLCLMIQYVSKSYKHVFGAVGYMRNSIYPLWSTGIDGSRWKGEELKVERRWLLLM